MNSEPAKRRRIKPGRIVLGAAAGLLVAAGIVVGVRFHEIRQTIALAAVRSLRKSLHARIAFDHVGGDLRHQLSFDGLSVKLESGDSIHCERIGIDYNLWQILRHKYVISNIDIATPHIFLVPQRPAGAPAPRTLVLALSAIRVSQGMVWYADTLRADGVALQLSLQLDSSRTSARIQEGSGLVSGIQRLGGAGVQVRALSGRFAMQGSDIRAESVTVRFNKTTARLALHANPADSLYDLTLEDLNLDASDLPGLPAMERLKASGRLSAHGSVKLQMRAGKPDLSGNIAFKTRHAGVMDVAVDTVEGTLDFEHTRTDFRLAVRDALLGSAKATGSLDFSTWEYSLQTDLTCRLSPAASHLPPTAYRFLPQTVTGTFSASGRKLEQADVRLAARVTGLPLDSLSLVARYEPQKVTVDSLEAERFAAPGSARQTVRVQGSFTRTGLDALVEADRLSLGSIDSLLATGRSVPPMSARVSGKVSVSGAYDHPAVKGELTAEPGQVAGFRFKDCRAEFNLPDASRLDGSLDVQVHDAAYRTFALAEAQLDILHRGFRLAARKTASLEVAAAGDWTMNDHGVVVECSSFTAHDNSDLLAAQKPFELRAGGGEFALAGFEVSFKESRIAIDASYRPGRPVRVQAQASDLDLNLLGRLLLKSDSLQGKLDLAVSSTDSSPDTNAARSPGDWRYTATVSASNIAYGKFQIELDRVAGRVVMDPKELYVDNLRLVHGSDTSSVTGSIAYRTSPHFAPGQMNLHAVIANPGVWTLAFLRGTVDFEKGSIYGEATITGTFDQPLMTGGLRLFNTQLYIPSIRQRITNVNAQFLLDRNTIALAKISGRSGDGDVIATGRLVLEGMRRVSDLTLDIHAAGAELSPVPDVVAIATGDVKLHWTETGALSITGNVTLGEALLAVEFGGPALSAAPSQGDDSLRLDLTIKADRNVWVRNHLADLEMSADLNVRKHGPNVQLSGELTTIQGRVYALDHSFQVTQGIIRFDNPNSLDPSLDITAQLPTPLRDSTSGLSGQVMIVAVLTGTASQPVVTISSSPPGMSQADIATYLATNIMPEELATLNDRQVFTHLISDRLLSYVSHEVTSRIQNYLDIDVLQLEIPASGVGLNLTVGKYIGKSLFVSYTASTTQVEPDAFQAEYFFSPGRELVGERQETGTYSLRYQFRLRY
jgi:autotransporter translocation and assembly factor TamB